MEPIRLLTIGLPNLLDEMLFDAFSKEGALKSFESCENVPEYLTDSTRDEPILIIVESMSTADCMKILQRYQKIRLVSVEDSGKRLNVFELVPQKQVLGEVSIDELVDRVLEK